MGKFKWIAVLGILGLLILPIGLFFIPSWGNKLSPMLNLVNVLMGEGAGDKMTLGSFSFVASDQDTLTLKIELGINNTEGPEMLFPAVNLTFNYGSDHLGDGWINPEVPIPIGEVTLVPIYAKMHKGEAFNKFLFSLIGGGLSLSIAGGQAYAFLDTFGGTQAGVITIPLPSIPLPAIDLGGAAGWPPTIHKVYRGNVTAGSPVEIMANVTDRGGGVKEVILSWNNGTAWVNSTMTGLPMKPIMGGYSNSVGTGMKGAFPSYPDSPILTACPGVFGIVHGQIPSHPNGSNIQYRVYVIDDYEHVTLVPSTLPTHIYGENDDINLISHVLNYTVAETMLANFTAVWLPTAGAGAAGGLSDMLNSLSAQGIDIFGAILAGSSALSGPLDPAAIVNIIIPLIEYFEVKGVNPFEIVDQLLGFSGGIGMGGDPNPHINSNASVALDLLAEGGVSLTELITALDVNLTKVVDSLGDSVRAPIEGFTTLSEAFATLLNTTFWNPTLNNSFFTNFLAANDLFYLNNPLIIYKYNQTDSTWTNLTAQTFSIEGTPSVEYYFGSMTKKDLVGTIQPGDNFTILDLGIAAPASPAIQGKFQWEYYNGSWEPLPVFSDETQNFTSSGRIFFDPAFSMQKVLENSNTTMWVRLKILAEINATVRPTLSDAYYSVDYIPYYFTYINVDMLGRPNVQMIPGEMDSFLNLMRSINETPSYGMVIWSLVSSRGITYPQFVSTMGGQFATLVTPITQDQILTTTTPTMAIIVYGILLIALVAVIRGRRGTYAIAPLRVKKWYDTMIVTPTLKGREEIDKYKMK